MSEVYVGNIDPNIPSHELVQQLGHEFKSYGEIRIIKLPSRGYAFVDFVNSRDALFAIHSWNGKFNWRVELSRTSQSVSASQLHNSAARGSNCYRCGALGHFARDCASAYDIKNKGIKPSQRGRMKKNQVASTLTWKPVPPPSPPWAELPEDIMANIVQKLEPIEVLWSVQKVCTTWRRVCRDPTMWRVINMWKLSDAHDLYALYGLPYNGYDVLCRHAVDLSQGQVTEFSIGGFLSDDLLEYIAERCGQLRCLRLVHCYDVSGETLSKAVKRFPLLEELHLQCTPFEEEDIEAIGQSSPMLRTFALNGPGCPGAVLQSSEEALAVAKAMPELRHLQLFGNTMTNEGLEAILNGCPKLDSLDLRHCWNLDLGGDLGKRCVQQIKNIRRPNDSTRDYEWDAQVADWEAYGEYFSDPDFNDDYDYDDLEFDDFCNPFQFDVGNHPFQFDVGNHPFQFDVGSEDSFIEDYYGSLL